MATLLRIDEPDNGAPDTAPAWRHFLSFAFRPFYLLAALQGALAVLAWGAGFAGTAALPGVLWHAHEMIWGYAGAVIVGFLLTAVATWTGQAPLTGWRLSALALLWLAPRVLLLVLPERHAAAGTLSVLFFFAAAIALAAPILRSRNRRNYGVPVLLLAFGLANGAFHLTVAGLLAMDPLPLLRVGLLVVATFIAFMGCRVIAFFTARALKTPQAHNRRVEVWLAVAAPLALALAEATAAPAVLRMVLGLVAGGVNLRLLARWWQPGVAGTPLLWVLFAGYGLAATGLALTGASAMLQTRLPALPTAASHLIAVGGIGLLTLGMMSRTALGHTGRTLILPPSMPWAYALMVAAALLRTAAVWPGAHRPLLLLASAAAFAGGLLLFAARFGPWLVRPRIDGMR